MNSLKFQYQVNSFLDVKSIGACLVSVLLAALPQAAGWVSAIISALTIVTLMSTFAYNCIRLFKEIFERKNNSNSKNP